MKIWPQRAFLALLFALLLGCGDPSGPRIPEPDEEEEPTDPDQSMTRNVYDRGTR